MTSLSDLKKWLSYYMNLSSAQTQLLLSLDILPTTSKKKVYLINIQVILTLKELE